MSQKLLKRSFVMLAITMFALGANPLKGQDVVRYNLWVGGVQVTSANCSDLTVIEGVSGKVSFDSKTTTLTLENASIHSTGDDEYAHGICNLYWQEYNPEGLTIRIIGNNTITAEGKAGIFNKRDLKDKANGKMTIVGDGKLTISSKENPGIYNKAYLTIRDCTIETDNPLWGISDGYWTFDNCNVRVRGAKWGSLLDFYAMPTFTNCSLTAPTGATWQADASGKQTLCGADGEPLKDWVEITRTGGTPIDFISMPEVDVETTIYTLDGIRVSDDPEHLDAGIYIIGGKKVIIRR